MSRSTFFFSVISILLGAASLAGTAHADECAAKVQRFNDAIEAAQEAAAQTLINDIATDGLCGRFQVPVQRRLAALRVRMAQDLMAKGRPSTEYESLLVDAAAPGVLWQAAATLAEVRFGERNFAEAARAFDAAIEAVKNESVTPTAPSKAEIQELVDRAAMSRVLEANTGSGHLAPLYVAAADDRRSGQLGGYFSPSVRGIVPHALPLPIVFDFDKATLTPVGQDAARELARAIREQGPGKVTVVGHTDVRGEADYNMKLSRERADTVATFLKQNGVDATIDASGVGASEPVKLTDTAGLTQDDIYALNRRVEWVREE